MKHFLAIALAVLPALAQGAPTPAARQEIAHLIDYLGASGCRFQRNGDWHDAPDAVRHLKRKVDYLLKRDLVDTAEDFIARAASESSFSGKSYQVGCGSAAPVPSGAWLRAELARYRNAGRPAR